MNQPSSRRFALIRSLRITLSCIEAADEFETDESVLSELKRIIVQRIADLEPAEAVGDKAASEISNALLASDD